MSRDSPGDSSNSLSVLALDGSERETVPHHFVYAIQAKDRLKIGYSSHPFNRLKDIQSSQGYVVRLRELKPFPNEREARAWEKRLHEFYGDCRTHGEWFDVDGIVCEDPVLSILEPWSDELDDWSLCEDDPIVFARMSQVHNDPTDCLTYFDGVRYREREPGTAQGRLL